MTAFTAATFGEVAPYLAEFGYQPVPIKPGYKFPALDGWQDGHQPGHYLPYRDEQTGRLTDCSKWGVGVLTSTTPGVDLDIRDRELVRVLIDAAYEMLGYVPFRVGSRPKTLLPYSTGTPFDKLSGRWWALPGDDWSQDGYSPHRVEVLGDGQQFVAYAVHPSTKRHYRWRRGCLMDTLRADLPEIDEASAKAFMDTAQETIKGIGGVPLRKVKGRWQVDEPEPEQTNRHRLLSIAGDRSWQSIEPEQLAKLISASTTRKLKSGGYICACPAHESQGQKSLSITPRRGGGSIVHCFAECSFADIADAISTAVGGAK